jgi:hypothetical protein
MFIERAKLLANSEVGDPVGDGAIRAGGEFASSEWICLFFLF